MDTASTVAATVKFDCGGTIRVCEAGSGMRDGDGGLLLLVEMEGSMGRGVGKNAAVGAPRGAAGVPGRISVDERCSDEFGAAGVPGRTSVSDFSGGGL